MVDPGEANVVAAFWVPVCLQLMVVFPEFLGLTSIKEEGKEGEHPQKKNDQSKTKGGQGSK